MKTHTLKQFVFALIPALPVMMLETAYAAASDCITLPTDYNVATHSKDWSGKPNGGVCVQQIKNDSGNTIYYFGLTDDVKNTLNNNTNRINDLNNHQVNTDKNVSDNNNAINDLNNHVSNTDKTITDHSNTINKLQNRAVLYDDPANKDKVTLNPGSQQVTLTNVANGNVAANSADAVNGSQLWQTNQNIAHNSQTINHLNDHVTNNEQNINNIINGQTGMVQTDGKTTTIDKNGTAQTISVSGINGDRVITGVAMGAVNAHSNEAVNGSQLYNLYQQIQYDHHENYRELSNSIERNRKMAAQGVASAMAMQIDMPEANPGNFSGGVGVGTYDGQTAMALGSHYLSSNGKYKYSAAISSGLTGNVKVGGKLSFGFKF